MLIRPAYVSSTYGVGEDVLAWIIAVAVGETTDLRLLREPMHLASDYIHPYKDAGDVPPTAGYASTSQTTFSTLPWLSARSYPTTLAAPSPTLRR